MDYFITDYGIPKAEGAVALEDSILQKGKPVTAGSKILEGFIAPFDATVVTRLLENDIAIAGKTVMNEFGIGSVSADPPAEVSGAVRAVAEGGASFALCSDVFGELRRQAAENGVCYIHPTYGTVSRYGLIPLAASMDQIGVVCKSAAEGFGLLSKIAGHDPKDGAMLPHKSYRYERLDRQIRAGLPLNAVNRLDSCAGDGIRETAERLGRVEMELEYFDVYSQTLYILACAEISNNISRYDGIKFGWRAPDYKGVNDLYLKTRTQAFGLNTKLAAIMGCAVLSQGRYVPLYEKAMKIRRLIKQSLRFDKYDVIILPTKMSGDPYGDLALFSLAPLAGLPSVSFSYGGCGVQLIADVNNENALLTAWEVLRS